MQLGIIGLGRMGLSGDVARALSSRQAKPQRRWSHRGWSSASVPARQRSSRSAGSPRDCTTENCPASSRSPLLSPAAAARSLGIPLLGDDMPRAIDLTIDGADEVNPALDLIKGAGGALVREKIVAQASNRVVIVVDASKISDAIGRRSLLPVEVLAWGWEAQRRYLADLGAAVAVREVMVRRYVSDGGNLILDCSFGVIAGPPALAARLDARAGIVGHGLFIGIAADVIVAGPNSIEHRRRPAG